VPVSGSIPVSAATAGSLGLTDGGLYEIAVFHAEREKDSSTFRLTLSGFNTASTQCASVCGDGIVTPDEQCDDAVNDGGYGECDVGCVLGEYCGDGIVNGPEDCDDGENTGTYGGVDCAPGCVLPPACGDSLVQTTEGEECDDGNTVAGDGCSSVCLTE
jgi:cysteine-rich repeat protein